MRVTATRLLPTLLMASGMLWCCALWAGIASAETGSTPPVQAAPRQADDTIESGQATWYGPRHEGHRTSSGEMFNSHDFTAAHATLPLGSYVRVTVQSTGRSLVVKVNDREPPHGVRCIDLSRAAAARLGIVGSGVADVTLRAASRDEAIELAEAPEEPAPRHAGHGLINRRHGLPHRRHAHR